MKKSLILKAILFSFVTILFASEVNAQKKCKYSFDKTDPMSNERVRRNYVKGKSYFRFAFYRKANDFRFETLIRFNGTQEFVVQKGQIMNVKLGNGEIIEVINSDDASPNSYVLNNAVMTNYSMSYLVTKEQMEKMANHGFTVVSTKLGNKTYTLEFKEKNLDKNKEKVSCMLVD